MSNYLKLITESDSMFDDYEIIYEQKNENSPKTMKITGPFLVAEQRNANGRLYKEAVMNEAVKEFDKNYIQTGRAFGEMNHPQHTRIDYDRACHLVTSLKKDGNIWIGESKVLMSDPKHNIKGTKHGDVLASILQYGGKPGVSSRGVGEISENKVIDKIFKIIAEDVVSDPSGPGCFVNGIMESKDFLIGQHGDIMEVAINTFKNGLDNGYTNTFSIDIKEAYIRTLFEQFNKDLNVYKV